MKKITGLLIVLVALIGVLYLLAAYVHLPVRPPAPSGTTGTEMTVTQFYADSAAYTVHAQYPQFGIADVDAVIKSHVEKAAANLEAQPQNPQDSATPKNEFTGTFDKVYVGPDIISVELILSEYTGGAHPNTLFDTINVDRKTGKELTLDDAFALIGMSLQQISDGAKTQLQTKLGQNFQFQDGADPKVDNYTSFLVSADKVTFVFQDYQVAAYVYGPQEVVFPRK